MSFLYRPQRGGLSESMLEALKFDSKEELIQKLSEDLMVNIEANEISIKKYVYDDRIKWDTHIVLLNGNAIGYVNKAI
jgi:hypothetical protein